MSLFSEPERNRVDYKHPISLWVPSSLVGWLAWPSLSYCCLNDIQFMFDLPQATFRSSCRTWNPQFSWTASSTLGVSLYYCYCPSPKPEKYIPLLQQTDKSRVQNQCSCASAFTILESAVSTANAIWTTLYANADVSWSVRRRVCLREDVWLGKAAKYGRNLCPRAGLRPGALESSGLHAFALWHLWHEH